MLILFHNILSKIRKKLKRKNVWFDKNVFKDYGFQNMFVYRPTFNTLELKENKGIKHVIGWKSKGTCFIE